MAEEYIKRNDVMDRVTFCRMEDPVTKVERVTGVVRTKDILSIPAADVVEVVRCGECKSWCSISNGKAGTCKGKVQGVTKPDDFCSRGERRGNNAQTD